MNVADLQQRFLQANRGVFFPEWVTRRLYDLSGGHIEYADARLTEVDGHFEGGAVVFGQALVIVTELTEFQPSGPEPAYKLGRVRLSLVPRSALKRLDFELLHGREEGSTLTYAGLERSLVLPLGNTAEEFQGFRDRLVADLGAPGY